MKWWDRWVLRKKIKISFYVAPNTVKYFSKHFPECKQTPEKQTFSVNHLHLQTFYGGECFTSKQTEPKIKTS
jgi:hypothetical protein